MRRVSALLLVAVLFAPTLAAQQVGTISTYAGGGPNNLPALAANLSGPISVAVDAAGNFYIAALYQHRVFKVDATGLLTVVAGRGFPGFSGDGGPATSASLYNPYGVALDHVGNLFIADNLNNRIRRVDASTGIITTVAGIGTPGYSGDGGPATNASLRYPNDMALDGVGNLFIADTWNLRIRRVDAATGIISTVAGTGVSGYSGDGGPASSAMLYAPADVALDGAGNLFIADFYNHRIRRVNAATGIITTVAGNGVYGFSGDGGPATSASLANPVGVALDNAGNFFIADYYNQRIRRVDAATGIITTVAGNGSYGYSGDGGPATSASLANPVGVAPDGVGNLFIADSANNRIRRVVLNRPPVANAGPDRTVIVAESVLFDGSASSDPDGTIASYQWDFGDSGTATGPTPVHVYTAAGQFTVTLTVTDDYGATDRDTALVTVQTPAEAIGALSGLVQSYNLAQGISNALDTKLENVREALDAANAGQRADAANKLQAFINAVEAQRGKELTNAQADELIALALRILGVL